jgi:hypothetical protein
MADPDAEPGKPASPKPTDRARAELAARLAREAAALRANLKRRRVQAQNRTAPDDGGKAK